MYFQEENVWACLAAMATYAKDLNTAEVAYAAIQEVLTQGVVDVIVLINLQGIFLNLMC